MTKTLAICSMTWDTLDTDIILCPWKNPLETLKKGKTSKAKETHRITKVTSWVVFPPVKSPIINSAICGANRKRIIKAATAIKPSNFLPIWKVLIFASCLPSVLYSFIILLTALGTPAVAISKKCPYIF